MIFKYFLVFLVVYKSIGYVLFTILTSANDLWNYILLITLQLNIEVFGKIYDVKLYKKLKFIYLMIKNY